MKGGLLTGRQISEICLRYQAGESANALSKVFGLASAAPIIYHVKRHGISVRGLMDATRLVRKLNDNQVDEICKRYQAGESSLTIAKDFQVSKHTVRAELKRRGLQRTAVEAARLFNKSHLRSSQKIIHRYLEGESSTAIARDFNCGANLIRNILKGAGIDRRPPSVANRKCTLNESAFDSITEESAYWLGFLMADGAVCERKDGSPVITLKLKESDLEHVESFRKFLGSSSKISRVFDKKGHSVALTVTSRHLVNAVARYGVTPRKSFTAKVVGLELNKDFWRGCVDGDGCLPANPKKRRYLIALYGSSFITTQFAAFISELTETMPPVPYKDGNIYALRLYGVRAMRVIDALYSNCTIALPRKLERAERILESRMPAQRRPYQHSLK
jgi:uncharacterized protein (DUF433 family)